MTYYGLRTVYAITFGSGKQLFPGLTATGINSVRGALPGVRVTAEAP